LVFIKIISKASVKLLIEELDLGSINTQIYTNFLNIKKSKRVQYINLKLYVVKLFFL
jgi:uncharacterized protein YaiL (DUF2058 family)